MIICHACSNERPEDLLPCARCRAPLVLDPPAPAAPKRRMFTVPRRRTPQVERPLTCALAVPPPAAPRVQRRCWNCCAPLGTDEECTACDARLRRAAVEEVAELVPAVDTGWNDPFSECVLPGLRARLELAHSVRWFRAGVRSALARHHARFVQPVIQMAARIDPRASCLAAGVLVLLAAALLWSVQRIEREARLGFVEPASAAGALERGLLFRATTALPRAVTIGGARVTVAESWIAEVGRCEFDGLDTDAVRAVGTGRYRLYIRLAGADPKLALSVSRQRGGERVALKDLGAGVFALDLRDAFPGPAYYRLESARSRASALVRVH